MNFNSTIFSDKNTYKGIVLDKEILEVLMIRNVLMILFLVVCYVSSYADETIKSSCPYPEGSCMSYLVCHKQWPPARCTAIETDNTLRVLHMNSQAIQIERKCDLPKWQCVCYQECESSGNNQNDCNQACSW